MVEGRRRLCGGRREETAWGGLWTSGAVKKEGSGVWKGRSGTRREG